jgi:pimeloyl-ACP methyl ester carboxylesterase
VPFVDIHSAKIRYREGGRGRPGPPVLFIHGAGGSSAIFLTSLHRVAPLRHAVALDLPGHGRSTGQTRGLDDHVAAVGATAAALCLGRSILVGHSLGGLVALACALAFPDKVAGLVLVTTGARLQVSPGIFEELDQRFSRWPEHLAQVGFSPETPADVRRRGASLAVQAGQAQTRADFVACAELDARPRLGEIAAPTLVVSGADDLVCPVRWADGLEAGIPGARRLHLARCGHFPMFERPDAFGDALVDAVGRVRA